MYSELNDIFEEAVNDHASRRLNGSDEDAMLSCGIKIVRYHEDDNIEIYNTAKGGDYYKEIEEDEYNLFFDNGWVAGVCKMSLKKYKERLETIKNKMKDEINGRNNAKYISFLKDTIRTTMNKYYNTTQKLNKL